MKTFKNLAIAAVAFTFLTTSCVENTVSPTVEAIRGQQVEWMKAKVAAEAALTAMTNAEIDYKKAVTADQISQTAIAAAAAAEVLKQQQAINANTNLTNDEKLRALKALNAQAELTATMNYNAAKVTNDVEYAKAQTELEKQKLALKNATDALALATVNAKSAEATAYYGSYVLAANDVAALTQAKIGKEKLKADNTTAMTFVDAKAANLTAQITATKLQKEYDLKGLEATLKVYKAVAIDPTSIQTQIDNLMKINQKYQVSIDSAKVVYENKTIELNAKNLAYNTAVGTVTTYNTLKNQLTTAQTDSTTKEAGIKTLTDNILTLSKTLITERSAAATALEIYTNAKANSDAKKATYDALKATTDAAKTTLDKANAALTLANANLNADPTNATLITAQAAAQTAQTAASTAYSTALGKSNTANSAYIAANNITISAKSSSDAAADQVKTDEAILISYQTAPVTGLAAKQQALADVKLSIADTRAKITAMTAAYNTALTTSAALNIAYQAAVADRQKTTDVINAKQTLLTANASLMSSLNSSMANATAVQNSIVSTENAIRTAKDNIASLADDLANVTTTSGKTALTNANAVLELEIKALVDQIANADKLAKYFKGLLDKLFV